MHGFINVCAFEVENNAYNNTVISGVTEKVLKAKKKKKYDPSLKVTTSCRLVEL